HHGGHARLTGLGKTGSHSCLNSLCHLPLHLLCDPPRPLHPEEAKTTMIDFFIRFSMWALPLMIGLVVLHGYLRKVVIFSCFVEGAAEAITLVVKILPYVVAIYFAVELFQVSGALNWL